MCEIGIEIVGERGRGEERDGNKEREGRERER
jgi:hypothetical protein